MRPGRPARVAPALLFVWLGLVADGAAQARPREARAPLTLGAAVAEALSSSPALSPSNDRVDLAELDRRVTMSRFALKLTPSYGTGQDVFGGLRDQMRVDLSKRLPFGTDLSLGAGSFRASPSHGGLSESSLNFAIAQPLLRGFGPAASAEIATATRLVESAGRHQADAREALVAAVASAFYDTIRQQQMLEASERSVERAARLVAGSAARASVGLATQLDVLRAELLASQAQAGAAAARESLAGAEDSLKLLLGRRPDGAIDLDASPSPAIDAPAPDVDALVRSALDRRIDVREALSQVDDARRSARVARWNLLPEVTATASYTRRQLGPVGSPFDGLFDGWRFGVTTSYPLDRTSAASAKESADIGVRAAERRARETADAVAADVRRQFRAWQRAGQTIALQQRASDLAEKQLRLAQLRYERGLADNFDIVDAETNLFQARTAVIGAQASRAVARLALDRSCGTLDPARFQP